MLLIWNVRGLEIYGRIEVTSDSSWPLPTVTLCFWFVLFSCPVSPPPSPAILSLPSRGFPTCLLTCSSLPQQSLSIHADHVSVARFSRLFLTPVLPDLPVSPLLLFPCTFYFLPAPHQICLPVSPTRLNHDLSLHCLLLRFCFCVVLLGSSLPVIQRRYKTLELVFTKIISIEGHTASWWIKTFK